MRIETNLPNASNVLSGVHFAKVAEGSADDYREALRNHAALEPAGDKRSREWIDWELQRAALVEQSQKPSPWLVSEEVERHVGARFLSIAGFREAQRSDQDLEDADAAIAELRSSGASVGGPSARNDHTIAELQQANQAMGVELAAERSRREEAERALAQSKLPPNEQVRELLEEQKKLRATIAARTKTIEGLTTSNEYLGKQLAANQPAAAAPARAPRAAAVKPARRKAKRARKPPQAATAEPSAMAAAAGL